MIILDIYDNNNKNIINNNYNKEINNYNIYKVFPINTVLYEWKILNKNKINEIKLSLNSEPFHSDPFEFNYIKWGLIMYPNGNGPKKIGSVNLYIRAFSIPPKILQLSMLLDITIKETNNKWKRKHEFSKKTPSLSLIPFNITLKTNDIQNIDTFTLNLKMITLDLYDKHGNIIKNLKDLNDMDIDIDIDDEKKQEKNNNLFKITKPISMSSTISYIWCINDKNIIKQIKNVTNVFAFVSPIFKVYGTKWYIDFWPNGSRESRKGTINIFFNLASFRSISTIYVIKFNLLFIESGKSHTIYQDFSKEWTSSGGIAWPLKNKDIYNLNKFTFKVDLSIIDIYQNDKIVTKQYINDKSIKMINVPLKSIEWNINSNKLNKMKKAKNGDTFKNSKFEMYDMKWYISIQPNGKEITEKGFVNLCINNISLPLNTSIISIRYSFTIIQAKTRFIAIGVFDKNNRIATWASQRLSTKKFNHLQNCTIKFDMELIDIYNDVKHKNNNNNNNCNVVLDEIDSLIQIFDND